jgi:hypothetical protein
MSNETQVPSYTFCNFRYVGTVHRVRAVPRLCRPAAAFNAAPFMTCFTGHMTTLLRQHRYGDTGGSIAAICAMVIWNMTLLHIPIDRFSILYVNRSYVYSEVLSIKSERLGCFKTILGHPFNFSAIQTAF